MFTKVTVGHLEVWEIQSVLKVTSCMLKGWVVLLEASVALRMEHQESTHKAFQVQLLALGWEEAIVTKTAESRSRTYSLEYIVLGVGNGLSLLIITVIYWTFNYKHCGELFFFVSFCSPGWPRDCSLDLYETHGDPPASAFKCWDYRHDYEHPTADCGKLFTMCIVSNELKCLRQTVS